MVSTSTQAKLCIFLPTIPPSIDCFSNGTPVRTTTSTKYLGSVITWDSPYSAAITARISIALAAYNKLAHVWRSHLPVTTRQEIFQTVIVPTLLYGLDTLTLDIRSLQRIDGAYFRLLRRLLQIKPSYISRLSHERVWIRANRPAVPSQRLIQQQFKHLLICLTTPPTNPIHHVIFSPAFKDRIQCTGAKRGRPTTYWFSLTEQRLLHVFATIHPLLPTNITLRKQLLKHPTPWASPNRANARCLAVFH